ncbi:phospholipase A2 [Streptomyces microflavus]|uniref:phospholipase A2 n=1 Tax=Streptomyces microflavus TaxID=1919 RepID=UPI003B215400
MSSLFRNHKSSSGEGARSRLGGRGGRGRMVALSLAGVLLAGGIGWTATQHGPSAESDTVGVVSASGSPNGVQTLVSAEGSGYALAEDGSGIYKVTALDAWVKVGDGARQIFGGGAGLFATSQQDGSIARYADGGWTRIGDPGAEFAVTDEGLFGLTPDKSAINQWTSEKGWTTVGGPAEHLYGGGAGLFATSQQDGSIARYADGGWTRIGDPGAEFAVTDEGLFGLSPDKSAVNQWTSEKGWTTVGGPAEHLYGGDRGLLATARDTGNVMRLDTRQGTWETIGGPGALFLSVNSTVYGVGPDRAGVARLVSPGNWLRTAGLTDVQPAVVSVDQKVQRLNEFTQQGDEAFNAWVAARASHFANEPDPYKFNWEDNGCNVVKNSLEVAGFRFKNACVRHDFGYRNYQEALGEEGFRHGVAGQTGLGDQSPKAMIDLVFKQDLHKECNRPVMSGRYPVARPAIQVSACTAAADEMVEAVVAAGS